MVQNQKQIAVIQLFQSLKGFLNQFRMARLVVKEFKRCYAEIIADSKDFFNGGRNFPDEIL